MMLGAGGSWEWAGGFWFDKEFVDFAVDFWGEEAKRGGVKGLVCFAVVAQSEFC